MSLSPTQCFSRRTVILHHVTVHTLQLLDKYRYLLVQSSCRFLTGTAIYWRPVLDSVRGLAILTVVGRDFPQLLQANIGIQLSWIRDLFRWRSSQFITQKLPSHFLRLSINRPLLRNSTMFPVHHQFFILH